MLSGSRQNLIVKNSSHISTDNISTNLLYSLSNTESNRCSNSAGQIINEFKKFLNAEGADKMSN